VTIARTARTAVFPARFMLVGAMNPCPCGYLGDTGRECRCTPQQIARYRDRLSGPLRDRLDLTVEVAALPPEAFLSVAAGEPSKDVRARVISARDRQRARYAEDRIRTNAELTPALVTRDCVLDGNAERLLANAVVTMGLSARAYDRVRKVARTIADVACADVITREHVAEALQYRML
jgi:magnesium chelatase family protein